MHFLLVIYVYKYMYPQFSSNLFNKVYNASDDLRNRFSNLDSFFVLSGGKKLFLFCQGQNLDALVSVKSLELVIEPEV